MKHCRACLADDPWMFLPFGPHPPANAFLRAEQLQQPEAAFDLATYICLQCGMVQIPDQVPAGFFEHYLYVPSASETMKAHFSGFAATLRERFLGEEGALLADIGCNDGLFLSCASAMGIASVGIDPAANIAELAQGKGLNVVTSYFSPAVAGTVREQHGQAKVIVTTNTLNHVDDLHGFMEGVQTLLAPDGVFVVETPQALHFVQRNEFDTIYHEHLSVFTVTALQSLYGRFGFTIFDIEDLSVHGGSMRVYAGRGAAPSGRVNEWLQREKDAGLFSRSTYVEAAEAAREIRDELVAMLGELKRQGKRIAGYGAPAKGNTLLNYCGIGTETLDYLVDRNPLKHGLFSPGMHIPIRGLERLAQDAPDYLLILAWNFADEIMQQQSAFREGGGRFLVPIPAPVVIG